MRTHLKLILAYLKEQWMWSVFIGYEIFAMLLGIFTHYDIAIPCMSKLILNKECPGCGMTRGTMCLLQGDFQGAAHYNSGVFIVLPLIIGIIIFDFFQFKNKRLPLLLAKREK